ncbi:MAG: hypothetical protein JXR13_13585 [Thalassovita sp.]
MKAIIALAIPAAALFLMANAPAIAAPSGGQICKKMISDGRGAGMSQSDCLCTYRVADAVLDENIKSLLFGSWFPRTNNMKELEQLPKLNHVAKQLETLQRALQTSCGFNFAQS